MRIELKNNSIIESVEMNDSSRGVRSKYMYYPMELSYSYKWLYENYYKFKIWVHKSNYSNKKRVRNKYINKIIKEMRWLENEISKM